MVALNGKEHVWFSARYVCICFPLAGCNWLDGDFFTARDTSELITWQDGRCSTDFLSLLPKPHSHVSVATGFGCATIFWFIKNRSEFTEENKKQEFA